MLTLKQILTAFTAICIKKYYYYYYYSFLRTQAAPTHVRIELKRDSIRRTSHMLSCEWTRRLSGHFSFTRTACKNLSASVNELSDERLSGFSNISTTLRCASSFNPSSPGWRDYFKMWTLRLRLCHQSAPRSSQVMQYSAHHSLHFSKWV